MQQTQQQHSSVPHMMHKGRTAINTAVKSSSIVLAAMLGSGVNGAMGVMVGVAMGVMVGVANAAVRESVVATKRKQRNMVKMHFHWFACVHPTRTATKWATHEYHVSTVHRYGMHNHTPLPWPL